MQSKWISIFAFLIVILSIQCRVGLGEASEEAAAGEPHNRKARQTCSYYSYSYSYCNYYYSYSGYTDYSYAGGWVYAVSGLSCCFVFCLPCIITAIVVCCCLCIPGCILNSNRKSNQVMTTTTITAAEPAAPYPETAYPQTAYPQTAYPPAGYPPAGYPPAGYPQAGYPQAGYPQAGYPQPDYTKTGYPQTGYSQPVQANEPYPPQPQDYYPEKAPDGNFPNPGYNAYPTDQAPPSYTTVNDQPQTHGVGFQP